MGELVDELADDTNVEELRDILLGLDALADKDNLDDIITSDDELHQYIKDKLGIKIPRVAVCPHHNAPFELISDLFFNRVAAAILVAGRGGGKTMTAAAWQFLNMRFIPEVECASVGAVDIQAKRAYQHFKTFQRKAGSDYVISSLLSETIWSKEQKYEVLTGSINSVNGPHPQKVHRDEVELMDPKVFQESLQMEKSKRTSEGTIIPRQTLITSTRKRSDGIMQELLDECKMAIKEGRKPPYKVYTFCIKEVVETQPSCRMAYPDLPEDDKCDCNLVKKGEWQEGVDRTLDTVCNGAFAKSDGFVPLTDLQTTFLTSSKAMWDAQQECKRPYAEDISIEAWSQERHGIYKGFEPDPDNGPIYQSIDFGGTNPHAVEWGQILDYEVEVTGYDGMPKRIPQGSLVLFAEIYIAEIGNWQLADLIVAQEDAIRARWPKFKIAGRFADPQAKAARLDFRHHNPPLACSWPTVTRDREEHFKRLNQRVKDGLFYVVLDDCPMFVEEIEAWNIKNKEFDHAMDSGLYMASNVWVAEKKRKESSEELPTSKQRDNRNSPRQFDDTVPGAKRSPLHSVRNQLPDSEKWRANILNV